MRYDLHALLNPKTIAIVGASERSDFTDKVLRNNERRGFQGKIYLVNPKRETVFGHNCYKSLSDIPDTVDVAALSIPAAAILGVMREGIAVGVKHFVINAAGFGEASEEGKARQQALKQLCEENDVGVIGPNCLGYANVKDGVYVYGAGIPDCLHAGNVGAISQSGSVSIALLNNGHSFGFTYVASTGNEMVITMEDLLEYYIECPETKVIAMFLEGIRQPTRFMELAEKALAAGKPIVALKVGLTDRGSKISKGHTGSLAGSGRVNEAAMAKAGVIQVYDLDEMFETVELLSKVRTPKGPRIALTSISGGELGICADMCERLHLNLAEFTPETKNAVREHMGLGKLVPVMNPYDAGAGWKPTGFEDRLTGCLRMLAEDENVDSLVVMQQSQSSFDQGQVDYYTTIARAVASCSAITDKPVIYTSNVAAGFHPGITCHIENAGLPLLQSMGTALQAVAHMNWYFEQRRKSRAAVTPADPSRMQSAIAALPEGVHYMGERATKKLLASYGIPTTKEELATSADEAAAIAAQIGFPVVLKIESPDIIHKSDVGGVVLGLENEQAVRNAYTRMMMSIATKCPQARLDGAVVCQQVEEGLSLLLGVKQDAQFGPVVMLGMGGVLVEALNMVKLALPPFDHASALELIWSIPGCKAFGAFRGRPARDVDALADAIVRLGQLAIDGKNSFSELDINPITVFEKGKGCLALDGRVILDGAGG